MLVPGAHALEPSGFFGYFAITAQRAGYPRRVPVRRAQSAGHAVAHLTGRDRARRSRPWLVAPADRACPRRSKASSMTRHRSRACTRWLPRARSVVPGVRDTGLAGNPVPVRIYCSEHAHSSIDKAVILLGFGHRALRKIPADDEFRMRAAALRAAIAEDRAAGVTPLAVVATIGTTSTTSVDPVAEILAICRAERASGCTSMQRTPAWQRSFPNIAGALRRAGKTQTRSW